MQSCQLTSSPSFFQSLLHSYMYYFELKFLKISFRIAYQHSRTKNFFSNRRNYECMKNTKYLLLALSLSLSLPLALYIEGILNELTKSQKPPSLNSYKQKKRNKYFSNIFILAKNIKKNNNTKEIAIHTHTHTVKYGFTLIKCKTQRHLYFINITKLIS